MISKDLTSCVVLDLETTGTLASLRDRILEIGAVKLKRGAIIDKFHWVLTDSMAIGNQLGWEAEQVPNATRGPETVAIPAFCQWIGKDPLVAHGAAFDRKFLDAARQRLGKLPLRNQWHCTLKLAKQKLTKAQTFDLKSLCRQLSIPLKRPHYALSDAEACAQLLLHLIESKIENAGEF